MDSFDSTDDVQQPMTPRKTYLRSENHDVFPMAALRSSIDRNSFRTDLPEKNTFVHFDDVDDDGGAMIPTKTCPGSMESKRFHTALPLSSAPFSGLRSELQKRKKTVSFDDGEESPALASPTMTFSWARTMDPFESIEDVQKDGRLISPGKSCLSSVEKREFQIGKTFQIPGPLSHAASASFRNELSDKKKKAVSFDDGEDSPAVTSPNMVFSWARTMDPFECIDDAQKAGGSVESEELTTERNLRKEEEHRRGTCQPCAYFALRADGCRRGSLCEFCHLCDKKKIKRRKRVYRKNLNK
jgi:hypothetical protein